MTKQEVSPEAPLEKAGEASAAAEASEQTLPWWVWLAVVVPSFLARVFHLGDVIYALDDSYINVPNAVAYVRYGFLGPDVWWTQPLKHPLLYVSAWVFGANVVGWRMRDVLFGAGIVLLTFLLSRAVSRRAFPAIAAAALLALDPLEVAFSRSTSEDIIASFLLLAVCLLFLQAMRTDSDRYWAFTGIALGAAWATKWHTLLPGLLMLGTLFAQRRGGFARLARLAGYLGALPLAVYTAAFLPWASRGYSISDWISYHVDALVIQSSGLKGFYGLETIAHPSRWFTAWMGMGGNSYLPSSYGLIFNDMPVWLLFAPAVAYLLWTAYQRRDMAEFLIGGCFVVLYAFFLSANRPIFLYSALPLLPFGFIALGIAVDRLLGERARWAFLAVAVAWSLYLYPIASGVPVRAAAYRWLLPRLFGG
jgi:dolichyl-phosphate-mannose-protein mannosyltransferase